MIQKLQRKILLTIFVIFTTILLGILLFINFFSHSSAVRSANQFLEQILERSDSSYFQDFSAVSFAEDFYSGTRFYIVKYISGEATLFHSTEPISEASWQTLCSFTDEIISDGSTTGVIDSFRYMVRSQDDGSILIALLNISLPTIQRNSLLLTSLLCFLGALPVFVLISYLLSRWLVQPAAQAFERQQQFISDASHELKTPLAVINANADILESEIGPNKWLTYIQTEISRTSSLINSLLLFAKIDAQESREFKMFDLTQAILSVLMPFESAAYEKEVLIQWDLPSPLSFSGDEEQLKQLTAILVDNAINHAYAKTVISVSLKSDRHKLYLSVVNQGDTIPPNEQERIFERFYRIDKARSRDSGHYGLGLAIAKSIVARHNGELQVQSRDGETSFTAVLPL